MPHCSVTLAALFRKPRLGELVDVVNQAIQRPLRVHLGLRPQREPVELLVVSQVGKHGLDGGASLSNAGLG